MKPKLPARALAALPCLLAACASSSKAPTDLERLAAAEAELGAGSYASAVDDLQPLFDAGSDPRQRFFATYLIVQAHEAAAYDEPFLRERGSRSVFSLRGEPTTQRPSRLGHLVAVTYHAHRGRQLFAALEDDVLAAEASTAAPPLLPPELERLGPDNALASLTLSLLAAHSRLDFEERIEAIVDGFPGLTDVEETRRLLEAARVRPAIRPWIHRAIFLHLRDRDEPAAYRFGVLALEAAEPDDDSFERAAEGIVEWIQEGSSYVFRSPAGQLFDPALPGCTIDGTPNLEFEAIPRGER